MNKIIKELEGLHDGMIVRFIELLQEPFMDGENEKKLKNLQEEVTNSFTKMKAFLDYIKTINQALDHSVENTNNFPIFRQIVGDVEFSIKQKYGYSFNTISSDAIDEDNLLTTKVDFKIKNVMEKEKIIDHIVKIMQEKSNQYKIQTEILQDFPNSKNTNWSIVAGFLFLDIPAPILVKKDNYGVSLIYDQKKDTRYGDTKAFTQKELSIFKEKRDIHQNIKLSQTPSKTLKL